MVEQTGVAGVVVGRGCLGRPWLFRDLAAAFAGEQVATLPTLGEVAAMMRRHAELLCEHMGEERGCKEFRKHVSWYLKGFAAGGELRRSLALVESLAGLDRMLARARPGRAVPDPGSGHPTGPPGLAAGARRTPRGVAGRRGRQRFLRPGGRHGAQRRVTRDTWESWPRDSDPASGLCLTRCSLPIRDLRIGDSHEKDPRQQQLRISAVAISHKRDTDARRKPKAAYRGRPPRPPRDRLRRRRRRPRQRARSQRRPRRDASTSQRAASVLASRRDVRLPCRLALDAAQRRVRHAQRAFDANAEPRGHPKAIRSADTKRWTTGALNLWTAPPARTRRRSA